MRRQDRRSDCPTNYALQNIGDSWSLLIVRDIMFRGKHTFSEFASSEERISTNILSDRLRSLVASGIIHREGRGRGRGSAYYLTRKGLDLLPAMVELILWSARHDRDTAAPPEFVKRAIEARAQLLAELTRNMDTLNHRDERNHR